MKKIFIKPGIKIVQLDNNDLICTSLIGYGGEDEGSGTAESRGGWWDDDE